MIDSKALKDGPEKSKLYYWWIDSWIGDQYYAFVRNFIKNPIYQVKRLLAWYWNVLRHDYDYDGHSLFGIIEYKLKRLEKALINGHAIHEPTDLKALKVAIKLAGRLKEAKYEEAGYDRIERKWGKLIIWFTDIPGKPDYSTMHSKYEKEKDDLDKIMVRDEVRANFVASHNRQKREEKWLYAILLKYLGKWWD